LFAIGFSELNYSFFSIAMFQWVLSILVIVSGIAKLRSKGESETVIAGTHIWIAGVFYFWIIAGTFIKLWFS
jgi:hypothetical protein